MSKSPYFSSSSSSSSSSSTAPLSLRKSRRIALMTAAIATTTPASPTSAWVTPKATTGHGHAAAAAAAAAASMTRSSRRQLVMPSTPSMTSTADADAAAAAVTPLSSRSIIGEKRVVTMVTPMSTQEGEDDEDMADSTTMTKTVPTMKKARTSLGAKPKRWSPQAKQKKKAHVTVTNSFEPLCSKQQFVTDGEEPAVPVHTLILGTHPSVTSLTQTKYYGHDMNAFWWIAGDCLGFRRNVGLKRNNNNNSKSANKGQQHKQKQPEYYGFTKNLRYGLDCIIPYEEQVQTMVGKGFAIWDIVASCQRPGSLDSDIRNESPNKIREFVEEHKGTLRRIVLANGGSGSKMFVKHFKEWCQSGELQPLQGHEASQKAFGTVTSMTKTQGNSHTTTTTATTTDNKNGNNQKIVLICALPVSPAAAKYSYTEKRDDWETHVYQPGLQDYDYFQQEQVEKIAQSKEG